MRKIFAVTLAVLTLTGSAFAEILAGPGIAVVDTEAGKLQGYVRDGIFTYHGVPYAQTERFMPPTKVPAWEGVRTYSHSLNELCGESPRMGGRTSRADLRHNVSAGHLTRGRHIPASLLLASLGTQNPRTELQLPEPQHLDPRTR